MMFLNLTSTTTWIILDSSTYLLSPLTATVRHSLPLLPFTIQFLWETTLSNTTLIYSSSYLYSNRLYPFPELLRSASFSSSSFNDPNSYLCNTVRFKFYNLHSTLWSFSLLNDFLFAYIKTHLMYYEIYEFW